MLNTENYSSGFLIDDQAIGGVTKMSDSVFASYVSDHATGETLHYQEFETLTEALSDLRNIPRNWRFESIGCSSHSQQPAHASTASGCSACSSPGGCGSK